MEFRGRRFSALYDSRTHGVTTRRETRRRGDELGQSSVTYSRIFMPGQVHIALLVLAVIAFLVIVEMIPVLCMLHLEKRLPYARSSVQTPAIHDVKRGADMNTVSAAVF